MDESSPDCRSPALLNKRFFRGGRGNFEGGFIIKRSSESYEFADVFSIKKRESELEERERRIGKMVFKVCSKCGERKPVFKFSVDKRNLDGWTNTCKACRVLEAEKYYRKNKDRIRIKNKRYRDTHQEERKKYAKHYREEHQEHLKIVLRKWYLKNRKAVSKKNLKYYQDHKEACLARKKLWRIKNREGIRKYNRKYKLRHKNYH